MTEIKTQMDQDFFDSSGKTTINHTTLWPTIKVRNVVERNTVRIRNYIATDLIEMIK